MNTVLTEDFLEELSTKNHLYTDDITIYELAGILKIINIKFNIDNNIDKIQVNLKDIEISITIPEKGKIQFLTYIIVSEDVRFDYFSKAEKIVSIINQANINEEIEIKCFAIREKDYISLSTIYTANYGYLMDIRTFIKELELFAYLTKEAHFFYRNFLRV